MNIPPLKPTGSIGGRYSCLGNVSLGYTDQSMSLAMFLGWQRSDNWTEELDFGTDDGGHPIKIQRRGTTNLTEAQILKAQDDGAIIITIDTRV